MEDPLEVVAGEISDESILLCLDEFMVCRISSVASAFRSGPIAFYSVYYIISLSGDLKVTDVADALILNRLFGHLFSNGIVSSLISPVLCFPLLLPYNMILLIFC